MSARLRALLRPCSLIENRCVRKGRKNFSPGGPFPVSRENSSLPVLLSTLAPSANPDGMRAARLAKGAGRNDQEAIMGNRAVITTPQRKLGVYLHWNGGRDTVEPLLRYCELKGYRDPAADDYGFARMCQVVGNFFGGSTSLGIMPYSTDERMDPSDNGVYVVEGWKIVGRVLPWDDFEEQQEYDFDEMLRAFDGAMPEGERLGEFLDSAEVPVSELELGDEVWMFTVGDAWKAYPVVGFGQPESSRIAVAVETPDGKTDVTYPDLPYVALYDHDGDFSWNTNNYVHGDTARIRPRK